MNLFGYTIKKSSFEKDDALKKAENTQTFVEDSNQDGSTDLTANATGFSAFGISFDQPNIDEINLITKYRDMAAQAEIEKAVDDIVNEAFSYDEEALPVQINLDGCKSLPEKTKGEIRKEFDHILQLLNFKNDCYEIFRRWYVDGRLYYHKVIDVENPKQGIKELRYIDPRKIKKVREEIKDSKTRKFLNNVELNKKFNEYYVFNNMGIQSARPEGLRIAPDAICYVHSGILDKSNKVILSHLHEAIRPFNQLNQMESAMLIYRIVRAPEKRVVNVEMGNLPKIKAEQYMSEVINKFTRKVKYDPNTGEIQDRRNFMSLIEDYWFPKRGGQGTTIESLAGGTLTGQIEDVDYFKKKLYESLKVPTSRMESSQAFNLGRASEITRDELKFGKFISRLRKRFSHLFEDILRDQLIMKGVLNTSEWNAIKPDLSFDFLEDNFYTEFKWSEVWNTRIATFGNMKELQGQFFSKNWMRKNILQISEEEWEVMQNEMAEENEDSPPSDEPQQFGRFGKPKPKPPSLPPPAKTNSDMFDDPLEDMAKEIEKDQ